jgi:hypothetical protein
LTLLPVDAEKRKRFEIKTGAAIAAARKSRRLWSAVASSAHRFG